MMAQQDTSTRSACDDIFCVGFSTKTYPHKEHKLPNDTEGDCTHTDETRNEFACFNTDEMSLRRENSPQSRHEEEIPPRNESEFVFESSNMMIKYDGDGALNNENKSNSSEEILSTETFQKIQSNTLSGAFISVYVEIVDTHESVSNTNHQMNLRIPKATDSSKSISTKKGLGIYERGMAMKAKIEQRREAESFDLYVSPLLNPLIATPQTKSSRTPLRSIPSFSADKSSELSPRVRSVSLSRDGSLACRRTSGDIDSPSRSVTINSRNPTPIHSRSRMRASIPVMFSFRDPTPPPLRTGSNAAAPAGLVRAKKYC